MRELQELLHEAVQSPPAEGPDLDRVLRTGQRRVRHRRVGTVAGAGVAVVAIAAGSVLASGIGLDAGDRVAPAGGTEPAGPVVHLAGASEAVSGRDYTLLSTLVSKDLGLHPWPWYKAVTPEGLIVVKEHVAYSPSREGKVGLLDPRTEQISWLPTPTADPVPDQLLHAGERWMVWLSPVTRSFELSMTLYDRQTQEWREVVLSYDQLRVDRASLPQLRGTVAGTDDRIYFAVGHGSSSDRLWSVSAEDPTDLRDEGVEVGDFDVEGHELTYTETTNEPSSIIHVRDLRTGEEKTFDAQSGSTCNELGMQRAEETIALFQYCGTYDRVRDDRIQVITSSGDPVATVQGHHVQFGALTSRYLTFFVSDGEHAGNYVLDIESGELLRLTQGEVHLSPFLRGDDSLLTWSTPVGEGMEEMRLWVAEFH